MKKARMGMPMTDELSRNEEIKQASAYLRGTLAEGMREEITGGIVEDDAQLVKFTACTCRTTATCAPSGPARRWRKRSPSCCACAFPAAC